MGTAGRIGLAVAVATALVPAAPARADLQLVKTDRLSPRLLDLTLHPSTPLLKTPDTHVRVLLPAGYDASAPRRYPVLYLLHGGADDYRSWTRPADGKGDAEKATAALELIVVMPDAGQGGWYTDWYNNGAGGPPMWESYHVGQLIPWVDAHYRTIADRAHRAIAGLSMGGFGAMSYAARHPDLFSAAATWSGAVDTNQPAAPHVLDLIAGLDGGVPGSLWGLRETQEVRWRGHNPWDLAANLRGMSLSIRSGNGEPGGPYGGGGDPLEPAVHQMSVSFHDRLTSLGIPHVWDDYGPGGHDWPYWNRDLREDLPRFMASFAHPPAAPPAVPFTYTTIEPTYDVYGWHVAVDRPVLEFSTLADAGADGFSLLGSGTATVTTAPLYLAGVRYPVTVESNAGTGAATREVTAGRDGRLTLAVPVGPPNAAQEYTVPNDSSETQVSTVRVSVGAGEETGGPAAPRTCTSRRSFVVHPRGVRARRVRRIDVYLNGKLARTVRGRASAVRVTLTGRPPEIVRVRLVIRPTRGRTILDRRVYRTCVR